jgi:site-specific DNA recombinase
MTEEFDTATATGRLMLTMLSGFAAHERDMIRERSMAGTDRLARSGAWLGGIVPYGYKKEGDDNQARLVIAEDEVPGLGISEAEVIRQIYRLAANERVTCVRIADYLNDLHVLGGAAVEALLFWAIQQRGSKWQTATHRAKDNPIFFGGTSPISSA